MDAVALAMTSLGLCLVVMQILRLTNDFANNTAILVRVMTMFMSDNDSHEVGAVVDAPSTVCFNASLGP